MARNNYTPPSLSGYNANPPPDDGSQVASNRVQWSAQVVTKIGDPLRTFAQAVSSAVSSAFDALPFNGITSQAATFTVGTADDGKIFTVTGNSTVNLPAAATAGDGFQVTVKHNEAANTVTIDADGTELIDGQETLLLTEPFRAVTLVSSGTAWTIVTDFRVEFPLPKGFIDGLRFTNNGTDGDHDIDIPIGTARDGDDSANLSLSTALTKLIDATFAEGTAAGGLDAGTVAADTIYTLWLIQKSSDNTADVLFSVSDTSPTMPTDFDLKRRIGAIRTDASANIIADTFLYYAGDLVGQWEHVNPVVATTSGDSFDLYILTDEANYVEVHWSEISLDGNSEPQIQLGPAAGPETTGYNGTVSNDAGAAAGWSTAGTSGETGIRVVAAGSSASAYDGTLTLHKFRSDQNKWLGSSWNANNEAGQADTDQGGGRKTTAGALEVIGLRQVDANSYDGGEWTIRVERRPHLS